MLWVLTLHITAMLFWGASLLYLPALIAGEQAQAAPQPPQERGSMARFVFTNIASPAALIAIFAGTAVFMLEQIVAFWLIIKLTLVTGLVVLHALTGRVLLLASRDPQRRLRHWCLMLAIGMALLITAILWTVLAKPFYGVITE